MRFPLILILLATAHLFGATSVPAQIDSGPITGRSVNGVSVFAGIPYAAPPVGELRWRAPQPVTGWTTARDCTTFSPECPQPPPLIGTDNSPQNEDCLYLNVWTPDLHPTSPLPVMFWIHGGGWTTGAGSLPLYNGQNLAAAGVVVVTINYRLGPFGFFAHPLLSAEPGGSGNYGLLDQIAALRWVQRNIAAFGGDPGTVTIFGESAGGGCVARLLLIPAARGLFHRAIIESAGLSGFNPSLRESEQTGARIAAEVVPKTAPDQLAALRAVPAGDLLKAAKPAIGLFRAGGTSYAPVVDGKLLADDPGLLLSRGLAADVPVLLGTNADEATVFTSKMPFRQAADLRRLCERLGFGPRTDEVLRLFRIVGDDVHAAADALIGVTGFVAEARHMARLLATPARAKVFEYHFTRVPPLTGRKSLGAFHSAEIAYVFGRPEYFNPFSPARDEDRRLSDAMLAAWVRFAATGDPNGGSLPAWPAYDSDGDACMEFGDRIAVRRGLHRAACDLTDAVRSAGRPAP